MDYELITKIKLLLKENGNSKMADELDEIINYSSTGGEIVAKIGSYLIKLKNNDKVIYSKIEIECEQFLKHGRDIGLEFI